MEIENRAVIEHTVSLYFYKGNTHIIIKAIHIHKNGTDTLQPIRTNKKKNKNKNNNNKNACTIHINIKRISPYHHAAYSVFLLPMFSRSEESLKSIFVLSKMSLLLRFNHFIK